MKVASYSRINRSAVEDDMYRPLEITKWALSRSIVLSITYSEAHSRWRQSFYLRSRWPDLEWNHHLGRLDIDLIYLLGGLTGTIDVDTIVKRRQLFCFLGLTSWMENLTKGSRYNKVQSTFQSSDRTILLRHWAELRRISSNCKRGKQRKLMWK